MTGVDRRWRMIRVDEFFGDGCVYRDRGVATVGWYRRFMIFRVNMYTVGNEELVSYIP